ncbi:class I SAM-dependent methyltransferase [Desulfotalea psychrophila]|uniref:Methyltransferase domain-containing protein n=1 Tax=Desulfotalea psychrophila (strain LSv54 / DSM 12343) TaxID=177439 RepID=Q6AMP1_DESPS|nr:class I SAM-dependent methyltransferase [Desulfotalea psychrophila]CAG36384.1 conserved hypothetical protein [Desulfotalea psychrophila LSv54]
MIYDSYDDEPEDQFTELDEESYTAFYQLEMGQFKEDLAFYEKHLPAKGRVLELGCGAGRLSQPLIKSGWQLTGVDLSPSMLKRAGEMSPQLKTHCMDIRQLQLDSFPAIIAPYNVLNLLTEIEDIKKCLRSVHGHLLAGGVFLAEFAVLREESTLFQQGKTFQFQIFDMGDERLVKEIIRHHLPEEGLIEIEERYRLRIRGGHNSDQRRVFRINALREEEWRQIIGSCGFSVEKVYNNYTLKEADTESGRVLAVLRPQ